MSAVPEFRQGRLLLRAARLAQAAGRGKLAAELCFAAAGLGWYQLNPFPGYTGRPHRATAAAGALFARFLLEEMEPVVESVLAGCAASPPPIMPWLERLSLGGRLGGIRLKRGQMPDIDA